MKKATWIVVLLAVGGLAWFQNCAKAGYNEASTSGTPVVAVNSSTATPVPQSHAVTQTFKAQSTTNKLDILLILDNSNSMLPDNTKLANRLNTFVTNLGTSSADWQMCATVTSQLKVNGTQVWGASVIWPGYGDGNQYILKAGAANLPSIFSGMINSVGAGGAGTDDERGIFAAWWHLDNGDPHYSDASGCYRKDAALAMILISDEDERSVGGDASQADFPAEVIPLEANDLPDNLVAKVKTVFGATKVFTFNSIIVKPGDTNCKNPRTAAGSTSHYGVNYDKLSQTTNGGEGSICDSDYDTNLNLFNDRIQASLASISLNCVPTGDVTISTTPAISGGVTAVVNGQTAQFVPLIPVGTDVTLAYNCLTP